MNLHYRPIKTTPNLPQLVLLLCSMASSLHAAVQDDPDFAKVVQPFIVNHCMDCHDADSARAGFRIDTLGTDFTAGNTADQWKEVMDNINSGKMPPKKKARPDAKEAFAAASWVAAKLRETELAAQGSGWPRAAAADESRRVRQFGARPFHAGCELCPPHRKGAAR